jgi:nifR3 family TIM-barrel protein
MTERVSAPLAAAEPLLPHRAALKIGPIEVDPPVVLAPMAGVTNQPFRTLCRGYGAALYVSEMVSARAVVERNPTTETMLRFGADEPLRSVQLYGVDPQVVHAAVRYVVDEVGADHIDLNFGCPAQKVNRVGGGAALPLHRVLFGRIVAAAVHAAGAVPVTVKMRKGIDDQTPTYLEAARVAEDAGVAAIALHARTAYQLYSGRADWAAIAKLREAVTSVPVLGNGDIWTAADALTMMRETGCAGVVVGRGCLGRPWLFRQLAQLFAGAPVDPEPVLGEVVTVMKRHLELLAAYKRTPELGVRSFRKHVGWYLTGFPVGAQMRRALMDADTVADLGALLDTVDPAMQLPAAAVSLPRGHLNGPRPVDLPAGWRDSIDDPRPPLGADLAFSGG